MPNFESASLRSIENLNPKLLDEVREKLARGGFVATTIAENREALERALDGAARRGGLEPMPRSTEAVASPSLRSSALEAIVLAIVRPPLLVQGGTFVPPNPADTVPEVMRIVGGLKRDMIDPVIARTARVELANVPNVPYVGTGWIVDKPSATRAIIVTNRHVAKEFARADGRGGYYFNTLPNYRDYQPRIDFHEEHGGSGGGIEAPVMRVVFIAGDNGPDVALLEAEGEALYGLTQIELSNTPLRAQAPIGVVGYPAYDSRSDADDVAAYFGNIFDVKRFAFGDVTGVTQGLPEFTHDATTLGGNSGSCVFDRETGKAVGLHFAGDYKIANYAVPTAEIEAALRGLKTTVVVPSLASVEATNDGRHAAESFRGRDGYDAAFLEAGAVHPPGPGAQWQDDLTDVGDAETGGNTKELKYRHFSVWMCKSRKLPLITAVNIDGEHAKRLGRVDKWFIDGRLGNDFQVDNAAYAKNPLDRGHMVRREDPVWGSVEIASEANIDTFHYTNAAPQHEDLNQRDWVRLEDYILGNARTRGLKVSVFTGPILGDNDRDYRGLVRLPLAFWKVAAVVNDETGKLSITGYVLAQGDLIRGLTGEFVYGAFRTYQVEVGRIGELARLDVAHLAEHDPFAQQRRTEGVTGDGGSFLAVNGPADLVL